MDATLKRLYDAYRERSTFDRVCEQIVLTLDKIERKRAALEALRSRKTPDQRLALMQTLILA